MGSSGKILRLQPRARTLPKGAVFAHVTRHLRQTAAKGPPAPRNEVFDLAVAILEAAWEVLLPQGFADQAHRWIRHGSDSLLTIADESGERTPDDRSPATAIGFWFYESASWPQGLAEHWLDLALAAYREEWEKALAWVGYTIHPEDLPTLRGALESDDAHYLVHDGRIGAATRKSVRWLLDAERGNLDETTARAKMSDLQRTQLDEALAAGACGCPACGTVRETNPISDQPWNLRGVTPHRLQLLSRFDGGGEAAGLRGVLSHLIRRPDGSLVAALCDDLSTGSFDNFVAAAEPAGPWRRLEAKYAAFAGYKTIAFDPRDDAMVMFYRDHIEVSTDGGATWATKETVGLKPTTKNEYFSAVQPHSLVLAAAPTKKVQSLFRSTDAGRTWSFIGPLPSGTKSAQAVLAVVPGEDERSFVVALRTLGVFVTRDAAQTWQRVALPMPIEVSSMVSGPGSAVGIHGLTADGATAVIRSGDMGASWSVAFRRDRAAKRRGAKSDADGRLIAFDARWFLSIPDGKAPGLLTSHDAGLTFEPCAVGAGTVLDRLDDERWLVALDGALAQLHLRSTMKA